MIMIIIIIIIIINFICQKFKLYDNFLQDNTLKEQLIIIIIIIIIIKRISKNVLW